MSGSFSKLAAVASFTEAAARIYADGRLSAQEKGARIIEQYAASVARLRESGELTRAVAQELRAVAEMALQQVEGLSRELGHSLTHLLEVYQPAGLAGPAEAHYRNHAPLTISEWLAHWWDTTFLPWWRDDSC